MCFGLVSEQGINAVSSSPWLCICTLKAINQNVREPSG